MKRVTLASIVAGLMLSAAPMAIAQVQQEKPSGGSDTGGGSPQTQGAPNAQREPASPRAEQAEPKAGKGTAQSEPKAKDTSKGTANQGIEPKAKTSKGATEKSTEPKGDATKGTAEKAEPKASKGAEKAAEPKEKATKGTAEKAAEPKEKATKGAAETKGGGDKAGRVQTSDQQKSTIGQTLTKEKGVNRVTNVNFSINVGTRVPRSLRLVALPASVITIVPAYRAYHYVIVDEQICIVDPATYEIVDVIVVTNQTAVRSERGPAMLVLSDSERALIISEIRVQDGSTMGLGALSEGADVPRNVELHPFSDVVVEKVPKLRGYKFFAAENRLAIVDPNGAKVQLVIDRR